MDECKVADAAWVFDKPRGYAGPMIGIQFVVL